MGFRLAAVAVLMLHLAFVLFVVAGALLAWRRRIVLAVHLPAALWGFWIEASGAACPLTGVENYLRERAGLAGYSGGFIEHYLLGALYPEGLARNTQYVLAAAVVVVNAVLYVLVLRHARHARPG